MTESGPKGAALGAVCPTPRRYESIRLGHGSGGLLSRDLLEQVFLPRFGDPLLSRLEDQAVLEIATPHIAFTTDAFVVQPLFFPGGDIGSLAVHGTLNDLAVGGAQPRYLSASFILEEGLSLATLERVVDSMAQAARAAGVRVVCGDTKVVERGHGDGVFITTSGVGELWPGAPPLSVSHARPGDRILVSGTLAEHGIAVMAARHELGLHGLCSDQQDVTPLCRALCSAFPGLRAMRDPTRGGLAAALDEIARASGVDIQIDEASIPLRPEVAAACEILGLDPLTIANEGKLVAVVDAADADAALACLRRQPLGAAAALVGSVVAARSPGAPRVSVCMPSGAERLLTLPAGEPLPRIC